ncbi:hypothetical protein S40285_10893, partial [Stachybotrys chlorohalonatus IBT 40285]
MNRPIEGAQMKLFAQMWKKECNYTGKAYDILDDKVRIFTDLCGVLQIRHGQLHALFPSILSESAQAYFLSHMNRSMQFRDMYLSLKEKFDSEITRAQALGPAFKAETHIVSNTLRAVQGMPELKIALTRPEKTFNALSAQLQGTMKVEENTRLPGHFYIDRKYEGRDRNERMNRAKADRRGPQRYSNRSRSTYPLKTVGKCWICRKEDCRSVKHPIAEQERAKEQWKIMKRSNGERPKGYQQFIATVEGYDSTSSEESEEEYDRADDQGESDHENSMFNTYTAHFLADESYRHRLGTRDEEEGAKAPAEHVFNQYNLNSAETWYGIIPDTGAASISTAGKAQTQALLDTHPGLQIKESGKGDRVRFGAGEPVIATGIITVPTPIGRVTFHIVPTNTPFLLCIKDMDNLGVYLDNTRNELVKQEGKSIIRIPVIRRWGHPWFFLDKTPKTTMIWMTEAE